jgi:hypothetical protein
VAAAIPSYAMSTFLLPKIFCRKLDQLFMNFWWGFSPKKIRNLSLKSWNSICSPKALGGLGFRKMEEVNLALISKLGWKLLSPSDSMWVNQLQGKYLLSGSFLFPPPPSPFCPFMAMERHPLFIACHFPRSLPKSPCTFLHPNLELSLDSNHSLFLSKSITS